MKEEKVAMIYGDEASPMHKLMHPAPEVLKRIGTAIVHAKDFIALHERDDWLPEITAFNAATHDREVIEWIKGMQKAGLIPESTEDEKQTG